MTSSPDARTHRGTRDTQWQTPQTPDCGTRGTTRKTGPAMPSTNRSSEETAAQRGKSNVMAGRPQERSQLPGWGAANQGSITHSDPQDRLSAPQSLAQHRSLTRCTAQHPLAFRKEKRAQPALHDAPGKPGTARVRGDSETRRLQRDPGQSPQREARLGTAPGQVRSGQALAPTL